MIYCMIFCEGRQEENPGDANQQYYFDPIQNMYCNMPNYTAKD